MATMKKAPPIDVLEGPCPRVVRGQRCGADEDCARDKTLSTGGVHLVETSKLSVCKAYHTDTKSKTR